MYNRTIYNQIKPLLFTNQVLILYGARQVGKTTLAKQIAQESGFKTLFVDCDRLENQKILSSQSGVLLERLVGDNQIIILDEAQKVLNIGINLKILHTTFPNVQFIATGSSSFDLANKINEPLTGRNIKFTLYPLSLAEISQKYNAMEIDSLKENILRFGLYPGVFDLSDGISETKLNSLAGDYLYKDTLQFEEIRKSNVVQKLLKYIAVHVGSEFSYNELGSEIGINRITVEKYLDLLEQCFIIFRLKPLKRSITKEISSPFKVYFWDIGIRNSIIEQYAELENRSDIGAIWENFVIVERIKNNQNQGVNCNYYFWRTVDGKEYDLIEERNGKFIVLECKWSENKKIKAYPEFLKYYPNSTINVINRSNWYEWLI
jgi:uncharacterized protein